MLVKSYGFVLKKIDFSETSVIIKVLTQDFGLCSFLVKGAKSTRNNKSAILHPMNEIEISFNYQESKKLHTIRECKLVFAPDANLFGIYKSSVAMFMIELINKCLLEDAVEDKTYYDFIKSSFEELKSQELSPSFYLSFMYFHAYQLGISMEDLPELNFRQIETEKLLSTKQKRREYYEKMELHYRENLHGFQPLKSIKILESIL